MRERERERESYAMEFQKFIHTKRMRPLAHLIALIVLLLLYIFNYYIFIICVDIFILRTLCCCVLVPRYI